MAAHSATIASSGFNVNPSSTSVDATGANVKDWGTFLSNADFLAGTGVDQQDNTNFDALKADFNTTNQTFAIDPATNSKSASGIGDVIITERAEGEYTNGSTSTWQFTVNDGTVTNGTYTPLGAVNGVAGNEDIFNITFNDVGAGQTLVTLYMAHSNTGRLFDATVDLTASDGNVNQGVQTSAAIGGTGGTTYFTYEIEIETTDALADLSISIDSNSGGAGQFAFAGYTVIAIPEPSVALFGGLGTLLLLRRRKR